MSKSKEEILEESEASMEELRALKENKKKEIKTFKDVQIERSGTKIILPENMTYEQGRTWLTRQEEAEETEIELYAEIDCFPLDGAYAFYKAITHIYGFTQLQSTPGFFGSNPPRMITIPTGYDTTATVPWGRIAPPGVEGYLQTRASIDPVPQFILSGVVKKKHERALRSLIDLTKHYLRTESCYKGKAIKIDLEYLYDEYRDFDITNDAPKFMDTSNTKVEDLILNDDVEFQLNSSIWSRITRTEEIKANNIPLKHGLLLAGTYGTGKTLTATVTAKLCEENGWTFIYLKNTRHLAGAIHLAELYAPAVIFSEDVDKATEGQERTDEINDILNTLDGVDTKDKPIITCLTTNHVDNINRAFLRGGRIDTIVFMQKPNEKSAIEFVRKMGGEFLADDIAWDKIGKAYDGMVPAFIHTAIQNAKMNAIYREDTDNLQGKVTTQDLVMAAKGLKENHIKLVEERKEQTDPEKYLAHVKQAETILQRTPNVKVEDEDLEVVR